MIAGAVFTTLAAALATSGGGLTFTVLKDTDTGLPGGTHAICAATKVSALYKLSPSVA